MIKKYLRNPIVIIGSIIILSLVFSISLYRVFCRLDQNIDWNAVNGITNIFLALITFCAVVIAIYIPRQDRVFSSKIELFDKRYEAFLKIRNIYTKAYNGQPVDPKDLNTDEYMMRLGFLINEEDIFKVRDVIVSMTEKLIEKEQGKTNYGSANEELKKELDDLHNIFSKYLDVRDF